MMLPVREGYMCLEKGVCGVFEILIQADPGMKEAWQPVVTGQCIPMQECGRGRGGGRGANGCRGHKGRVTQLTLRAQLLSPNGCKLMTQQLPSKMLTAVPGTLPYHAQPHIQPSPLCHSSSNTNFMFIIST